MQGRRRILVAYEERRIAIPIKSSATISDLADEIAATLNIPRPGLKIEIGGGFELRDQDGIDMILDGELVSPKPSSTDQDVEMRPVSPIQTEETSMLQVSPTKNSKKPAGNDSQTGRIKISLVDAETARKYAIATVKEVSEVPFSNGVLAFGGEYVSGNTTLRDLQKEAVRVIEWDMDPDASLQEDTCQHQDAAYCSCAVALELEQYGLTSTLHCRLSLDGRKCGHNDCPYSHVELEVNSKNAPLHCSVCDDAIGFPCPSCLEQAEGTGLGPESVVYCPIVQNAGCFHIHHAHCLRGRRSLGIHSGGCPSGCPAAQFPREAIDFEMSEPHLILAWSGDKIDRVPIPKTAFATKNAKGLSTDKVIDIVQDHLTKVKGALRDLSLRIHFRDASDETVRFTNSTLVSICSPSKHTNENYRRFPIFPSAGKSAIRPSRSEGDTFTIDFHTDKAPIAACGCTKLSTLFPTSTELILYVVKRITDNTSGSHQRDREIASKQSIYVSNPSWHPSIQQTERGIAAFLASLYVFADFIARKGSGAEQRVLEMVFCLCRFPPAVRALAILMMNRVPQAYEKAALAEAVFWMLKGLSGAAPDAIAAEQSRLFELSRLLLAHIINSASENIPAAVCKATETLSLVCASSQNRLTDPVLSGSSIVQRQWAILRQPDQALYRPTVKEPSPPEIEELESEHIIRVALAQTSSLSATVTSIVILRIENLLPVPSGATFRVETLARHFDATIRQANKTELVTRGPLDLKSVSVIPPQIVLDQQGLLAVFTGRGCGSTQDVNFFRPTKGGDTEVDVNEVAQALEPFIRVRKSENTWQIDSFDGASAETRPPDEAIVLCLDLSRSMDERSGVSDSKKRSNNEDRSDPLEEADEAIRKAIKGMAASKILSEAKEYLQDQHQSCLLAWRACIYDNKSNARERRESASALLCELDIITRRDFVQLQADGTKPYLGQMACFASACRHQISPLVTFMLKICNEVKEVGEHPFAVPLNLLDPKTGDLMENPVTPSNAPSKKIFVDEESQEWFESQDVYPIGHIHTSFSSPAAAKTAIDDWVSGRDLLPNPSRKGHISVYFDDEGQIFTWQLQKDSPISLLYQLANRATRAAYSSFELQLNATDGSCTRIENDSRSLDSIAGLDGGTLEIESDEPHERENRLVIVSDRTSVLLPQDAPILSLLSYGHAHGKWKLTEVVLWAGLTYSGDGVRTGSIMRNHYPIDEGDDIDVERRRQLGASGSLDPVSFELTRWRWIPSTSESIRQKSRYLTRLHLLKELFNVFVNRISSFDTKTSLVLGLVTFSDNATVKQELSPIFENFRKALDTVSANGDTAVYDALDKARKMLTDYRKDLPNLRKRIIIVSDGDDTSSKMDPTNVCKLLHNANVLVDSVQVGTSHNPTLHAISVATGGYRFFPKTSLGDALSIFDLETMLNSGERPRSQMKILRTLREYENTRLYPIDKITMDQFPKRAEHPKLRESVRSAASTVASTISKVYRSDDRMKRIMQEIQALVKDPHPNIDIYPNDTDISFLKIILEAPKDSTQCPYKDGCFLLTCDFPPTYPRDPPEIRFVTFILHPNVSKQGKVCVAELGRLWSSDISLKDIFNLIYGLLLEPDLENPLEIQASLKYYDDDGTYALSAADAVAQHAWKTREDWRKELGGEDDQMDEN